MERRYRIIVHGDDDDKKYGIPELKKYPMPDAKHVRSAIKFFNYVEPKYEKELANAILNRMQEYGMSFDNFTVGEENRFSKYMPKEDTLEHHGILGQKWGIRRFQNPDGSWTEEGRKRYSNADGSLTEAGQRHMYKSMKKSVEKNRSHDIPTDVGKEVQDRVAQAIYKNKEVCKEYKDAIQRYDYFRNDFDNNEKLLREYAEKAFKSDHPDILEIKNDLASVGLSPDMLDVLSIDSRVSSAAFDTYISKGEKGHKEYVKVSKRLDNAFNDYIEMRKKITESLLGKYGNRTINDSYYSSLPRSAEQVLTSEINQQINRYI
ncbi:MAG: hypothetical protein J6X45_02565 [Lachnospiraceae bacterium]|nr:hypothetical protein [Lachnospiraceae bacterium]